VHSGEDLLALRARQLQLRDEDMEEIILRKRRIREEGKERFDWNHSIRLTEIKEKDIVLAYYSKRAMDMSSDLKLSFRWLGPYRVKEANATKGTYVLEELDGTQLKGTYAGNRLKKFIYKKDAFMPVDLEESDSSKTGSTEEEDSWEGDSAKDDNLPRSAMATRSTDQRSSSTQPAVVLPGLTEAERSEYVRFSAEDS